MKIFSLSVHLSQLLFDRGPSRPHAYLHLINEEGDSGWGEIAPLPPLSRETLEQAVKALEQAKETILSQEWTAASCVKEIARLALPASSSFALESALLSLLSPLPSYTMPVAALLMGTYDEILAQAAERQKEGYTTAKLKVGHLRANEAQSLIAQLYTTFRLRIDVNRAWKKEDALRCFAPFPFDAFEYVEEPFQDPRDLAFFSHPLAIDESFPADLSLEALEDLPTLKALIYKPTIQGGLASLLPLLDWTKERKVELVLGSTFESALGLCHIASLAYRLQLSAPLGLGTYHFLRERMEPRFAAGKIHVPEGVGRKFRT